jgi:hypothetical protein
MARLTVSINVSRMISAGSVSVPYRSVPVSR